MTIKEEHEGYMSYLNSLYKKPLLNIGRPINNFSVEEVQKKQFCECLGDCDCWDAF